VCVWCTLFCTCCHGFSDYAATVLAAQWSARISWTYWEVRIIWYWNLYLYAYIHCIYRIMDTVAITGIGNRKISDVMCLSIFLHSFLLLSLVITCNRTFNLQGTPTSQWKSYNAPDSHAHQFTISIIIMYMLERDKGT